MNGSSVRQAGVSQGRLYRDTENAWLLGVCAGIADSLEAPALVVRGIAAASLLLFFWATVAIYAVAAVLFREKPLTWSGPCGEQDFWRRQSKQRHWSHS